MKQLLFFLVILNLSFLNAQSKRESEIEKTIENMFEDVFSKTDINSIDKYFSPNLTIFEDGMIYNLDSIRSMVGELKNRFDAEKANGHKLERKNNFEFYQSKIDGNTAYANYTNTAGFFLDGNQIMKIQWLESAVLEKINNEWKISFLHSTQMKNKN